LMSGMGVLHLEIKKHRMERDFKLKIRVSKPRVSYRETIRREVRVEGDCSSFAGASSMFGKVTVVFEPLASGEAISAGTRLEDTIRVLNELDAEKLPHLLAAAAERGIRNALTSGDVGYPVMKVQAAIVDARWDPEHSTETAFEAAGTDAVRQALRD